MSSQKKDLGRKWKDFPKEERVRLTISSQIWFNEKIDKVNDILKKIYEAEPILKEVYNLNLDHQTIWSNLFDEMLLDDIMKVDDEMLVSLVHDFAKKRRDLWLKPIQKKINKSEKLSIPQIALIHYYNGVTVTRVNANEIIKRYGYTSGEKLFQVFSKYSSRSNRIEDEGTDKKNLNKLKLLESIIPFLNDENQQKAIDEINTLKSKISF